VAVPSTETVQFLYSDPLFDLPVTTAWSVLKLRMEGSRKYTE